MVLIGLALLIIPIIELAFLIQVGSWIGVWPTIGLLILVSVLGAWLVKHEGMAALRRVQSDLGQGRLPARHLVDGVLILLAGVLLLTPGFISDVVGLLLLLPPTRAGVRAAAMRRFRGRISTYTFGRYGGPPDDAAYGRAAAGDRPGRGDEIIDI